MIRDDETRGRRGKERSRGGSGRWKGGERERGTRRRGERAKGGRGRKPGVMEEPVCGSVLRISEWSFRDCRREDDATGRKKDGAEGPCRSSNRDAREERRAREADREGGRGGQKGLASREAALSTERESKGV